MYYFVDMHDDKLNFIDNISSEKCTETLEASDLVSEVLEFYVLGKCVSDAWDALIMWSNQANCSGNHLMRNMHTAERLVRGFLFELRTCLDHMETEIKRKYGESSIAWNLFKTGTGDAYDKCPAYPFTYHLRNCSQHCKNVVHGFNCDTGIGISSNASKLLAEYDKWKQVDKDYMVACGNEIDLLKTFSDTFTAFNAALAPVINHLLNTDDIGIKLKYLRDWGNTLHSTFQHDVNCFHIVNIVDRDGKSVSREAMATVDVVVKAYTIDWEMIFELSDLVNVKEVADSK